MSTRCLLWNYSILKIESISYQFIFQAIYFGVLRLYGNRNG